VCVSLTHTHTHTHTHTPSHADGEQVECGEFVGPQGMSGAPVKLDPRFVWVLLLITSY